MKIIVINKEHTLWDKTIRFAEKASWRAGRRLAERMKNNAFLDWEKVLIAVQDGEIIGFCVFENNGSVPEKFDDCHPFINSVFVDERYRGHRISEKLISSALQYARELGYQKVYLKSEHHGLYEKYGFRKIADYEPVTGLANQLFEIDVPDL